MLRARARGVKSRTGGGRAPRAARVAGPTRASAGSTRTCPGAVALRPRFVVVLAACLAALRPGAVRAQSDACEALGTPEVRGLSFRGNRAFTASDLGSRIATTRMSRWADVPLVGRAVTRQCLDADAVRLDAMRLLYFYRVRGFVDAQVEPVVDTVGRAVTVRFDIREGQPLVLRTLRIEGLEGVPEAARFTRQLPSAPEDRFDEVVIAAARDTLLRRLRNAGYPRADVFRAFTTDRAARAADVKLTVVPGALARIGRVAVAVEAPPGRAASVSPDAVRRIFGVRPGEPYREGALVEGQRRTYQTDAFRGVTVDLDSSGTDSVVNLRVRVVEQPMRAASVGAGWGTIDCVRAEGTYTDHDFLGGLRRLDVTARVSRVGVGAPARFPASARALCAPDAYKDQYGDTLNYYLGVTLRQPGLFGGSAVPEVTLYTEQRSEYNAYRRVTPVGLTAALADLRVLGRPVTLAYTLELGRTVASPALFCVVFTFCDADARENASEQRRFAAITASTQWDWRDDPAFPVRGGSLRLEARHVSRLVGADPRFRFNRLVGDLSGFTRLGADGVLTARLRLGGLFDVEALAASSAQRFVPVQERLFAGGPATVRGYRPNELGPVSYRVLAYDTAVGYARPGVDRAVPVPVGGTQMVVANLEYRVRAPGLGGLAQVAVFADGGQVWTRGQDAVKLAVGALRWTPGLGLRVVTAFGVIRLDFGYNDYRAVAGPAYFDTPLATGGALTCVSPPAGAAAAVGGATGTCLATFQPPRPTSVWRRITPSISIGQIF